MNMVDRGLVERGGEGGPKEESSQRGRKENNHIPYRLNIVKTSSSPELIGRSFGWQIRYG